MRIGLMLDTSLDPEDGVQQYVLGLGRYLTGRGHQVFYIAGQTDRRVLSGLYSPARNVHVRFNGNVISMPRPVSRRRLQVLLDELQLDILHVQVPYSPFFAGRLIKLLPDSVRLVGTFHVLPYSRLSRVGNDVLGKINAVTAKRFDAVLAVSEPARLFALQAYGLRSSVVPNGFWYKHFGHADGRSSQQRTIVYLGRLVERKGPLLLVEAVAQLRARGEWPAGWRVLIGGKGHLHTRLRQLIDEQHLRGVVELTGFVPDDHKAAFLRAADIAVFPSTSGESFGISVIEGMAAARGVVLAGNNVGYASVMQGLEDQLVDTRSSIALADQLHYYMTHPAERRRVSVRQRRHVRQFDWLAVGARVEEVYRSTLRDPDTIGTDTTHPYRPASLKADRQKTTREAGQSKLSPKKNEISFCGAIQTCLYYH